MTTGISGWRGSGVGTGVTTGGTYPIADSLAAGAESRSIKTTPATPMAAGSQAHLNFIADLFLGRIAFRLPASRKKTRRTGRLIPINAMI
jgi:hypothetical protein